MYYVMIGIVKYLIWMSLTFVLFNTYILSNYYSFKDLLFPWLRNVGGSYLELPWNLSRALLNPGHWAPLNPRHWALLNPGLLNPGHC